MTIKFYKINDPYGFMSNFAHYSFTVNGLLWPTSEHYFQAHKFGNEAYREKIRTAKKPGDAFRLGQEKKELRLPNWEGYRVKLMKDALIYKFTQNAEIREQLLATGDEELVENSPVDYFWGCGADGSGENMLGKLLVDVREMLRNGEIK